MRDRQATIIVVDNAPGQSENPFDKVLLFHGFEPSSAASRKDMSECNYGVSKI